jgi:hypothetical protein
MRVKTQDRLTKIGGAPTISWSSLQIWPLHSDNEEFITFGEPDHK